VRGGDPDADGEWRAGSVAVVAVAAFAVVFWQAYAVDAAIWSS
jgi:hypothetical protein